jgi:hypothetical protein
MNQDQWEFDLNEESDFIPCTQSRSKRKVWTKGRKKQALILHDLNNSILSNA